MDIAFQFMTAAVCVAYGMIGVGVFAAVLYFIIAIIRNAIFGK